MVRIAYADYTEDWDAEQLKYEFGAFYIFPSEEISEFIYSCGFVFSNLKHEIQDANIIVSPAVPIPIDNSDLDEVRANLKSIKPFEIKIAKAVYKPELSTVIYEIEPKEEIIKIRKIMNSLSFFKKSQPFDETEKLYFSTSLETPTQEDADELLVEINRDFPSGSFLCEKIEYAYPGNTFCFDRIDSLYFNQAK